MTTKKTTQKKRNFEIQPFLIGEQVEVHNGRSLNLITITKEMVGHKVGEFSKTKKPFKFKNKSKK